MGKSIGVVMADRVIAGLVDDHKLASPKRHYPEDEEESAGLVEIPSDPLCQIICEQIVAVAKDAGPIDAIGVALPGIIRNGVMEDSPNLHQLKGARIGETIGAGLKARGVEAPTTILNDADAIAAGLAATRGQLDRLVRAWTIGNGIGFGRYPWAEGAWEGGHTVVSLDPKENYCGCGGKGHLEGICGYRAMRLRFLDMEPDEVFAAAKTGDARCLEFVRRWHRALAAATATAIHLEGPGRFYFSGRSIHFLELPLLKEYLWEMVKMSPLQSYTVEVIPETTEIGIIGSAAAALLAARSWRHV
jgi:predicted NBD/HSP70 family sugar kinase